jgi:hypothetical protein
MRSCLRTAALAAAALVLALPAAPAAQVKAKDKKADEALLGGPVVLRAENELTKEDPKDKEDTLDKHRTDAPAQWYTYRMRKGKAYVIECDSKEIDSFLRLEDERGQELARDDDGAGYPNARIVFRPQRTATYKVIVSTYGKEAEGKEFGNYGSYTLTIRLAGGGGLAFKNGKAEKQDQLAQTDPRDTVRQNMYAKKYTISFKAGKTYQIDMVSNEGNPAVLDPYLRLEDAQGQQLAQDDDGGGFPNARIVFNCTQTGAYRIICTSFGANQQGRYTLTVQER